MRNVKLEHNLTGDEHWPKLAMVTVAGDKLAQPLPQGVTQPQVETIIQAWHRIAVLEVAPSTEVLFGFMTGGRAQFMNVPVETAAGRFGVHLGPEETTFFVLPKDWSTQLTLKLVEVTDQDNPAYAELPLY